MISRKRRCISSTGPPGSLSYPFSLASLHGAQLAPHPACPGTQRRSLLLPQRRRCSRGPTAWAPTMSSSAPASYLSSPHRRKASSGGTSSVSEDPGSHPGPSSTGDLWCADIPIGWLGRSGVTTRKYGKLNYLSQWRQRCLPFLPQLS